MTSNGNHLQGEPGKRHSRRPLKLFLVDAVALAASLCLAYGLRFDFVIPESELARLPRILSWVLILKLTLLLSFRQWQALPDYFGIHDLRRLVAAIASASFFIGLLWWVAEGRHVPPRGVILIDLLLSILLLAGIRLALHFRRERLRIVRVPANTRKPLRRVGIVGAGVAGAMLARDLRSQHGLGLTPVVFFDDDSRKWRAHVHNLPVVGAPELLLTGMLKKLNLDEVVISMPSAPPKRIREVVGILQQARLKFRTVPSLSELALGKVQVSQLRPVEIEDLLGRLPVKLATEAIRELLAGQTVMVTGAGGSIGSELCRQIAGYEPARLLLVERSEVAMFAIEQELLRRKVHTQFIPLVVDILDQPRLRRVFEEFRPRLVFHAAAHKHVPMMESQPGEAIRNNTLGTVLLAEMAIEFRTDRFVMISTDKAINPTSVMGATKRLAELYLQSLHAANGATTRLMAVRFGNVLGSSGSVIPIFKQQIAAGGPVTVTHPEMTRYFMTIPEAVGLVLQSAMQGAGGEVFVLDMGKPVKIVELARHLIELSGLEPEKDIPIQFMGLRPGEKLFEELNYNAESHAPTSHPKIFRFCSEPQPLPAVQSLLRQMTDAIYGADANDLKRLLKQAVPEYTPCLSNAPASAPPSPNPNLTPDRNPTLTL